MDVGRASWVWVMVAAALAASILAETIWTETSAPSVIYFAGALGGLAALRRPR